MPNSSARGGTTLDSDARTTAPAKPVPARGRHVPTTLTAVTAVVAVSGLVMVFPFVWEFLTSLKTLGESTSVPPVILPSRWRWDNYGRVFEAIPFAQQFLNTVVITVGRVAGQLLFCSLSAYAFARLTFRGANIIFGLFLSILMVPTQLYVIPQYQIMESLGWLNSLKALIVPGLFSAFGVFLLRQFFLALPRELEDAARTDGCNPIQTYWYVMLPLIRPGLIALGRAHHDLVVERPALAVDRQHRPRQDALVRRLGVPSGTAPDRLPSAHGRRATRLLAHDRAVHDHAAALHRKHRNHRYEGLKS